MKGNFTIAMIGAGNLAWHLGPALENLGHRISIVQNRSRKNALELTGRLYHADYRKKLDFSNDHLDMVIMAVSDQAVPEITHEIILPDNCHLVHTSGSQPLDILEPAAAANWGVLYPLQTFTRGAKVDFRDVPVFLESSTAEGMEQLVRLTRGLSKNIHEIDSRMRSVLHLAAVLSTNFSNHLFTEAKKILDKESIDYRFLYPLAETMLQKVFSMGPEAAQTGPALRKDYDTMDRHLELLEDEDDLGELYTLISRLIMSSGKN